MKIAIIGPGAMGLLFAAKLFKSDNEVTLIDKDEARAKEISEQGIKIIDLDGKENTYKVPVTTLNKKALQVDLVIIAVKSYDTEKVAQALENKVSDEAIVLSLQNGIGNIEALTEVLGADKVIGGVTSHGATLLATGAIRHAGTGDTVIGRWQTSKRKGAKPKIARSRLTEITTIFKEAGFKSKVSDNIKELVWSKLIINVGINALTAITGLNNGRLVEIEPVKNVMHQAVLEAVKLTKRKRISLIYSDAINKVESVCRLTGNNVSSMLQDVNKKKLTEIDYINGAIVREARSLDIKVPVNEVLTNLVKTIEAAYHG